MLHLLKRFYYKYSNMNTNLVDEILIESHIRHALTRRRSKLEYVK